MFFIKFPSSETSWKKLSTYFYVFHFNLMHSKDFDLCILKIIAIFIISFSFLIIICLHKMYRVYFQTTLPNWFVCNKQPNTWKLYNGWRASSYSKAALDFKLLSTVIYIEHVYNQLQCASTCQLHYRPYKQH